MAHVAGVSYDTPEQQREDSITFMQITGWDGENLTPPPTPAHADAASSAPGQPSAGATPATKARRRGAAILLSESSRNACPVDGSTSSLTLKIESSAFCQPELECHSALAACVQI